jgi:hypothetical protein
VTCENRQNKIKHQILKKWLVDQFSRPTNTFRWDQGVDYFITREMEKKYICAGQMEET